MKQINTSYETNTARQPLYAQSLQHLQDGYKEAINSLAKFGIKNYTTGEMRILHGCVNSGSYPAYSITAGAIYYNGEVYQVPAASFTSTGSDVAVANVVTTYPSYDPVTFSDGSTVQSVHEINQIVFTSGATGSGLKDFTELIPAEKDKFFLLDASTIGIASASYVQVGSFTYTTPDDGYTRNYLIKFKTEVTPSNGNATSSVQAKIVVDGVDVDAFNVGKGNGTTTDVYVYGGFLMWYGSVGPNKVISIEAKYTTAAASARNSSMFIQEL